MYIYQKINNGISAHSSVILQKLTSRLPLQSSNVMKYDKIALIRSSYL